MKDTIYKHCIKTLDDITRDELLDTVAVND